MLSSILSFCRINVLDFFVQVNLNLNEEKKCFSAKSGVFFSFRWLDLTVYLRVLVVVGTIARFDQIFKIFSDVHNRVAERQKILIHPPRFINHIQSRMLPPSIEILRKSIHFDHQKQ